MTDEAAQAEEGLVPDESEQPQEEAQQPDAKPEGGASQEPEAPQEDKRPRGVAKRLQELTRERDSWRDMALQQQKKAEAPEPEEPPKALKDFDYDEDKYRTYLFGVAEKRAAKAAENVARSSLSEFHAQQERDRTSRQFRAREAQFASNVKDYSQVAYSAPISDGVAEIVMSMDDGPEIAYYLGKNPDIAQSLSQLPPYLAGVELGRIANGIQSEKSKASRTASKAPAPTPKVEGRDPGQHVTSTDASSDKLSVEEWVALERKRLQAKK